MNPAEVEQRTDEWFEARIGKATASRFKDILAKIKSGESAARRNYRAEVMIGQVTGKTPERFKSKAMDWGTETEELARTTYMLKSGNKVDEVGFIQHPSIMCGASPDGLIGDDGCLEIKCFNSANHYETLRTGAMPLEHLPQVQGQMWLANRQWCDFVSFDPDFPAHAQIFIQRIKRDDQYIAVLEAEVRQFLAEVAEDAAFINNYKPAEAPVVEDLVAV